MYERDDFALTFQQFQATPFRQVTSAVVQPPGEVRTEWEIVDDLMARMARRTPTFALLGATRKLLGAFGRRLDPRVVVDGMIRLSDGGDRYGLRRGGLTFRRLARSHPHGVVVAPHIKTPVLGEVVVYRHGRARLAHDDIAAEIAAMAARGRPTECPMRMIGMREPRSENSWMHNAPLLMRGDRTQRAVMHVDDAAERRIADGDTIAVRSAHGRITLPVSLTDGIVPGTVAIPHGWGHRGTGGWQLANRTAGVNVNQLTSSDPADMETLAGMSWLTGVPVQVELGRC